MLLIRVVWIIPVHNVVSFVKLAGAGCQRIRVPHASGPLHCVPGTVHLCCLAQRRNIWTGFVNTDQIHLTLY